MDLQKMAFALLGKAEDRALRYGISGPRQVASLNESFELENFDFNEDVLPVNSSSFDDSCVPREFYEWDEVLALGRDCIPENSFVESFPARRSTKQFLKHGANKIEEVAATLPLFEDSHERKEWSSKKQTIEQNVLYKEFTPPNQAGNQKNFVINADLQSRGKMTFRRGNKVSKLKGTLDDQPLKEPQYRKLSPAKIRESCCLEDGVKKRKLIFEHLNFAGGENPENPESGGSKAYMNSTFHELIQYSSVPGVRKTKKYSRPSCLLNQSVRERRNHFESPQGQELLTTPKLPRASSFLNDSVTERRQVFETDESSKGQCWLKEALRRPSPCMSPRIANLIKKLNQSNPLA